MQRGQTAPAILDALGDPVRRVIYARLRHAPTHVTALAQGLPVTRSTVSRHLRVLADAGLVDRERDGARAVYAIRPRGLAPLAAWIEIGP